MRESVKTAVSGSKPRVANQLTVKAIEKAHIDADGNHRVKVVFESTGNEAIIVQKPSVSKGKDGEVRSTGFATPISVSKYAVVEGEQVKISRDKSLDVGGVITFKAYPAAKTDGVNTFEVAGTKHSRTGETIYPHEIIGYDAQDVAERVLNLENVSIRGNMMIAVDQGVVGLDDAEEAFRMAYEASVADGAKILPAAIIQPINENAELIAPGSLVLETFSEKVGEDYKQLTTDEAWAIVEERIAEASDALPEGATLQVQMARGFKVKAADNNYSFRKVNGNPIKTGPNADDAFISFKAADKATVRMSAMGFTVKKVIYQGVQGSPFKKLDEVGVAVSAEFAAQRDAEDKEAYNISKSYTEAAKTASKEDMDQLSAAMGSEDKEEQSRAPGM